MRLTGAVVLATVTLALGAALGQQPLWVPILVLAAALIDLTAGPWARSARRGTSESLAVALKSVVLLIGLVAAIGQLVCVGFALVWIAKAVAG